MATCKLCETPSESGGTLLQGICRECAGKIGLVAMPPSRRPPLPCPRCGGRRFVRSVPREPIVSDATSLFWGADLGAVRPSHAPLAVTYDFAVERLQVGAATLPPTVKGLDVSRPRGLLARYICWRCGFAELYCEDPASVPIGPEHMTDIVDYGGSGD